jgi:hypothetical protein
MAKQERFSIGDGILALDASLDKILVYLYYLVLNAEDLEELEKKE